MNELVERLDRASMAVLADYRGLSVAQLADLRGQLRPANVEVKIAKNTLLRIAAQRTGREAMLPALEGPTAVVFSYGDTGRDGEGARRRSASRRLTFPSRMDCWVTDCCPGRRDPHRGAAEPRRPGFPGIGHCPGADLELRWRARRHPAELRRRPRRPPSPTRRGRGVAHQIFIGVCPSTGSGRTAQEESSTTEWREGNQHGNDPG